MVGSVTQGIADKSLLRDLRLRTNQCSCALSPFFRFNEDSQGEKLEYKFLPPVKENLVDLQ